MSGFNYNIYSARFVTPKTRYNSYDIRIIPQIQSTRYNAWQRAVRNRKAGPCWISYLIMGVFYINFSLNDSRISYFSYCKSHFVFLNARRAFGMPWSWSHTSRVSSARGIVGVLHLYVRYEYLQLFHVSPLAYYL